MRITIEQEDYSTEMWQEIKKDLSVTFCQDLNLRFETDKVVLE